MPRSARSLCAVVAGGALLAPPSAAAAALPREKTLARGWEMRAVPATPAPPQPPPPEETQPEGSPPSGGTPVEPSARASRASTAYAPVRVPNVFDPRAIASLYPGLVRRYRIRFTAPRAPGFRWLIAFEEVRRKASVRLNGRLIGRNSDPYTPFAVEARGLRPRKRNTLVVTVDNRKDPRLREGWWNWGGIVRPVHLMPVGRAYLSGLGLMSKVRCKGHARRCRARLLLDGVLERRGRRPVRPRVTVSLRSPTGRVTQRTFRVHKLEGRKRRLRLSVRVPAPKLWSPDAPRLYTARVLLRDGGLLQQAERHRIGLRSVQVKRGLLYLNNRRIELRGASIHEDMPGHGAALTRHDMRRIVSDLQELGANVTRAHYLLSDRLLSMLDRAGIMVWNEAPVWQRDRGVGLLHRPAQRARALLTVRRTVKAARSHPSVIAHSVANELVSEPDRKPGTRLFLTAASRYTRDLDPTLPVAVDINGRPGHPAQRTYRHFDVLGINQYFGWYPWVKDFSQLEPYLRTMDALYPRQALVMTEFGAEARPELANAPADRKGGYLFQAMHTGRTLDLVDRLPFLSGAIYWTLREFEIYPGWTGGAGRRPPRFEPNTRHHKGLLTYHGQKKPAWYVARDHFRATPLYAP